jgi:hypothetical protein
MLVACRDDMQFNIDENEVFSGKTIINSLIKDFTIMMMHIDFLIRQLASPYYLSMELEVLYKNMLKQLFPSNVEWNEMLRFKLILVKFCHEMIIQTDEEKETTKVTTNIIETSHESQKEWYKNGRILPLRSRQLAIYLYLRKFNSVQR